MQSAYLKNIVKSDRIKNSDLQKEGMEIESRMGIDYGLLYFIKASLGVGIRKINELTLDQTLEYEINDIDRIKLIAKILLNISKFRGRQPVIFIDNLDQITERDLIQDFLRSINWFGSLPIIVTIRTEFVRENILRNLNSAFILESSNQKCLLKILSKRLENAQDGNVLKSSGLEMIALKLSKATENPWAFLRWLDYLCSSGDLNTKDYLEQLNKYIFTYFELYAKEVKFLAKWYMRKEKKFLTKDELVDLGVREALINIYVNQGILMQFDVNLPENEQLYTITPLLHFFKLEE
jgi:hypothetical protein